ncbi:hypothetical protein [Austwickia chelonae]|uniref:hypothetical protein n=1 Tax=Austwickia chelonae TaxID=100225 RepID=UPI000E23524E|nr:hypothetical protein [Austwickia chelonae]
MSGKFRSASPHKGIPPTSDPTEIYGSILPQVAGPSSDYEEMPIADGALPSPSPSSLYGSVLPSPTYPVDASRYEQIPMPPTALLPPENAKDADGEKDKAPSSEEKCPTAKVEMVSYETGPLPRIIPAGEKVLPDYAVMNAAVPASGQLPPPCPAEPTTGTPPTARHKDTSLWGFPPPADQPPPADERPVPGSIATATLLMKAAPVLAVAGVILSYVFGSFRGVFHTLQQGEQQDASRAAFTVAVTFVHLCIVIVLWWWMSVKNRQGHVWARKVYVLFFILSAIYAAAAFFLIRHPLDVTVQLIYLALGFVILRLLFSPDSSTHYRTEQI